MHRIVRVVLQIAGPAGELNEIAGDSAAEADASIIADLEIVLFHGGKAERIAWSRPQGSQPSRRGYLLSGFGLPSGKVSSRKASGTRRASGLPLLR